MATELTGWKQYNLMELIYYITQRIMAGWTQLWCKFDMKNTYWHSTGVSRMSICQTYQNGHFKNTSLLQLSIIMIKNNQLNFTWNDNHWGFKWMKCRENEVVIQLYEVLQSFKHSTSSLTSKHIQNKLPKC